MTPRRILLLAVCCVPVLAAGCGSAPVPPPRLDPSSLAVNDLLPGPRAVGRLRIEAVPGQRSVVVLDAPGESWVRYVGPRRRVGAIVMLQPASQVASVAEIRTRALDPGSPLPQDPVTVSRTVMAGRPAEWIAAPVLGSPLVARMVRARIGTQVLTVLANAPRARAYLADDLARRLAAAASVAPQR